MSLATWNTLDRPFKVYPAQGPATFRVLCTYTFTHRVSARVWVRQDGRETCASYRVVVEPYLAHCS